MSKLSVLLERLPDTKGAVVILSGGMDSTIALRLAVQKYSHHYVSAVSFYYGQRQAYELRCASQSCGILGVKHTQANIPFLEECAKGISANVDKSIQMPTIQDVLGDPAPKTEIPNRNAIMLHLAAAFSQKLGFHTIICGLQTNDVYSFGDCSQAFVDSINKTLEIKNRKINQKIISPFNDLSKTEEIELLLEMDNNVKLLEYTLTCYNPQVIYDNSNAFVTSKILSCGKCPSCAERLRAFNNLGIKDPLEYVFDHR